MTQKCISINLVSWSR